MDITKDLTTILFDLDGTIFHLSVDWQGLRTQITKTLGHEFGSFDELVRELKRSDAHRLLEVIEQAELSGVTTGVEATSATETLRKISKEFHLAVVTRNSSKAAAKILADMNIKDVVIIGREQVEQLKPSAAGLKAAITELGQRPEQAVMVGDTVHDVLAAHELGIPCIIVRNRSLAYEPPDADYYIDNLNELPRLLAKY